MCLLASVSIGAPSYQDPPCLAASDSRYQDTETWDLGSDTRQGLAWDLIKHMTQSLIIVSSRRWHLGSHYAWPRPGVHCNHCVLTSGWSGHSQLHNVSSLSHHCSQFKHGLEKISCTLFNLTKYFSSKYDYNGSQHCDKSLSRHFEILDSSKYPRAVPGVKGDGAGAELNSVSHLVSIKKVINVGFLTPVPPLHGP